MNQHGALMRRRLGGLPERAVFHEGRGRRKALGVGRGEQKSKVRIPWARSGSVNWEARPGTGSTFRTKEHIQLLAGTGEGFDQYFKTIALTVD